MVIFGRTVHRLTLGVLGIILILALVAFGTSQCAKRRDAASQARMDAAQGQAASESGRDASEAQSRVNANEVASETLSRTNEKEIRSAEGANEAVAPAVHSATIASLCRRAAYRDNERCRMLRAR